MDEYINNLTLAISGRIRPRPFKIRRFGDLLLGYKKGIIVRAFLSRCCSCIDMTASVSRGPHSAPVEFREYYLRYARFTYSSDTIKFVMEDYPEIFEFIVKNCIGHINYIFTTTNPQIPGVKPKMTILIGSDIYPTEYKKIKLPQRDFDVEKYLKCRGFINTKPNFWIISINDK